MENTDEPRCCVIVSRVIFRGNDEPKPQSLLSHGTRIEAGVKVVKVLSFRQCKLFIHIIDDYFRRWGRFCRF
jgi:hypothetical protein